MMGGRRREASRCARGAARESNPGHRKRAGRAAPEHWTGPQERGRPSARALTLRAAAAPRVFGWGARRKPRERWSAARGANEHWTGPQEISTGRPTPRGVELADGVWGHRKRAGRAAPEHWTGPQEIK